jgi:hypothetical protein
MVEGGFVLTGMVWNRGSCFWPDCYGLEWRESVLVGFDLTGMTWNGGSRFWPDWNGLKWKNSNFCSTEIVCKNKQNSKRDRRKEKTR